MIERLRKIPSWRIGLLGAAIAILSTILSSVAVAWLDSAIQEHTKRATALRDKQRILWDNHQLADERLRAAAIFVALSSQPSENRRFLLSQVASNLGGSVLAMSAAAAIANLPDEPPKEVVDNERAILGGDLSGYNELVAQVEKLRLQSQVAINGVSAEARNLDAESDKLSGWSRWVQGVQVSLTIVGLIVVLLKDLPVWKDKWKDW